MQLKTTAYLRMTLGQRVHGALAVEKIKYILRLDQHIKKNPLVSSGCGNLPSGFLNHNEFWRMLDCNERVNALAFIETVIDLPDHLDMDSTHKLAADIAAALASKPVAGEDVCYEYAVHENAQKRGRHMHLVTAQRFNDGITRTPQIFFRRYSSDGHGGAPRLRNNFKVLKQRTTVAKAAVQEIINECLRINKINIRIDFERTKKLGLRPQHKLNRRQWQVMKQFSKQLEHLTVEQQIQMLKGYEEPIKDFILTMHWNNIQKELFKLNEIESHLDQLAAEQETVLRCQRDLDRVIAMLEMMENRIYELQGAELNSYPSHLAQNKRHEAHECFAPEVHGFRSDLTKTPER